MESFSADQGFSFAMAVQDAILGCLTACSTALRQLQKLLLAHQGEVSALHDLVTQIKYIASSLSALNNVFFDPGQDIGLQIDSNLDLERLFQLTLRPCSLISSALLADLARTQSVPGGYEMQYKSKTYLSLMRSLRSGISILLSTVQR
jgi:hypothetical protein